MTVCCSSTEQRSVLCASAVFMELVAIGAAHNHFPLFAFARQH